MGLTRRTLAEGGGLFLLFAGQHGAAGRDRCLLESARDHERRDGGEFGGFLVLGFTEGMRLVSNEEPALKVISDEPRSGGCPRRCHTREKTRGYRATGMPVGDPFDARGFTDCRV